jgi:predicted transcriptional regulator
MSQGDGGRLVAVSVELTPDQERWLRTTAERVGESPDALVRQAIQLLRRLSTFRRLA